MTARYQSTHLSNYNNDWSSPLFTTITSGFSFAGSLFHSWQLPGYIFLGPQMYLWTSSLSNQRSLSRWQRSLSEAPLACMPVHNNNNNNNNNNNSYFKLGCVPQESLKGGPCNFRLLHSRTFCRVDALSAALPAESKHRRVITQKNLIKFQRSN